MTTITDWMIEGARQCPGVGGAGRQRTSLRGRRRPRCRIPQGTGTRPAALRQAELAGLRWGAGQRQGRVAAQGRAGRRGARCPALNVGAAGIDGTPPRRDTHEILAIADGMTHRSNSSAVV